MTSQEMTEYDPPVSVRGEVLYIYTHQTEIWWEVEVIMKKGVFFGIDFF